MTAAPINGHGAPAEIDPAREVARGLHASQIEDGDTPFDEMDEETQSELTEYCRIAIALHVQWLVDRGFRIVPPNATPIPKTQEEALAMVQAAKGFFDAQKRKGSLMSGAVGRKVILPKGSKLQ